VTQEGRREREPKPRKALSESPIPEPEFENGTPDDEIGAAIDREFSDRRQVRRSRGPPLQVGESFWMKMSRDEFTSGHGHRVVRARRHPNPRDSRVAVDDIFEG